MFQRIVRYYKPHWRVFGLDMFCALLLAVTGVAFPIIVRHLIRTVFQMSDAGAMFLEISRVAAFLLVIYIVQALANYYMAAYGHIMGAKIEYGMRRELFAHMEKLSFSYYDRTSTGQMASRILSDLFDITELAHHGPENILVAVGKISGACIFLFFINVPLTLVLLGISLFMFLFSKRMNREMRKTFRANRKEIAAINAVAQDSLSGIRTMISFNREHHELERFDLHNRRFLEAKKQNYLLMGRYHSTNNFLQGLMYLSVIFIGGYLVSQGHMRSSDIVTYVLYISMFLDPIKMLIQFTEMFQKGYTGFERMCEILDTAPEIQDRAGAIEAGRLTGAISFDKVSFAYEDDEPILREISLEIPPKYTLALVGSSGVGKTTFCSLIPRFYECSSGAIRIDGTDIRDYSLASLRENVGVVQQDVYIFNTSIRENIAYGRPTATEAEIHEAAKQANIHEFILSLPKGYETLCGEQGARLSGGQKQRLSIARVFLKNPPILILDEATSALDTVSERLIQAALEDLSKDRTTIVIAHRLSTIRGADEILVMTEAGIAERGTHSELMALQGHYEELYRLQFADLD